MMRRLTPILTAFAVLISTPVQCLSAETASNGPLEALVGKLIAGGEWRAPNPDRGKQAQPDAYALRYHWGPHRQHMVGELVGIFPGQDGEREVRYWTLYMFHNPGSNEARAMQVGWNGALADGIAYLDDSGSVVIEQTFFGPDGSASEIRHEETFGPAGDSYTALVFAKNANGDWEQSREWLWTRYEGTNVKPSD